MDVNVASSPCPASSLVRPHFAELDEMLPTWETATVALRGADGAVVGYGFVERCEEGIAFRFSETLPEVLGGR